MGSGGRYVDYRVTGQEAPPGCAPSTSRSVCGSKERQKQQRGGYGGSRQDVGSRGTVTSKHIVGGDGWGGAKGDD